MYNKKQLAQAQSMGREVLLLCLKKKKKSEAEITNCVLPQPDPWLWLLLFSAFHYCYVARLIFFSPLQNYYTWWRAEKRVQRTSAHPRRYISLPTTKSTTDNTVMACRGAKRKNSGLISNFILLIIRHITDLRLLLPKRRGIMMAIDEGGQGFKRHYYLT